MTVFDVETDGLLKEATKIHVLSYWTPNGVISLHDYDEIRKFLLERPVLIGHNIIRFDIPVLEKILGIKIKAQLIDTLALSWYLNHTRIIHGLEAYGEEYGVPKPVINDWGNLSKEEYAHRCEEDVKINYKLWVKLNKKLDILYQNKKDKSRIINYLSFKMSCLREQEKSKWKFDQDLCLKNINIIEPQLDDKIEELKIHMPEVPKLVVKTRPKKPYKADGSYSVTGAKWFNLLKEKGFPEDYDKEIKVIHSFLPPNPKSNLQVKDWLFELGWVPESFKYDKDADGNEKKIPQVRVDGDNGKELCSSVLKLADKYPEINILSGITVLSHRLAILKKFMKDANDGYLVAEASGFTNTLRLKHKILVNLPGIDKPLGKEIRSCLVAREGYVLCGSDMSSLEDNTKKHYMYNHDPDYVKEMSDPNFDAHLDLARFAGVVTKAEILDYVVGKVGAKNLKPIRKNYKVANYACIYGVGAPKLSRTTGLSLKEAGKLIEAYWGRNWAVKKVSEETTTKKINGEMWLFNPVSKFWYSLRYEKDIFSTLNQGTGVFCFDMWIREIRRVRPQLTGQFHDEIILEIKKGAEDKCYALLKQAINKVNETLKLNVTLDVDIQFGNTYADIH